MAFDFKKEYKEFYLPRNKPQIVTVPPANYIAVRGKGDHDGAERADEGPEQDSEGDEVLGIDL